MKNAHMNASTSTQRAKPSGHGSQWISSSPEQQQQHKLHSAMLESQKDYSAFITKPSSYSLESTLGHHFQVSFGSV
jgi:hypothetical protein